jgi:hypothetical protein
MPHAYVAQGYGGLTKVGYTKNPRQRRSSLKKEFKAKGDELSAIEFCDSIQAAFGVELALINHCEEAYTRHSGREWFTGCDFRALLDRARKETDSRRHQKPIPPMTAEEREHWRDHYAKRREEGRLANEARKALVAKRSANFQMKRRKSERVVAAVVAVLTRSNGNRER